MKIALVDAATLAAAVEGSLAAIDTALVTIQPGVFNLAVRMLGNRDDASDATQEILLKVVTHLSGFRGESAFATWVFRIARNHLVTMKTRVREWPEVSLDAIAERLQAGLDFATAHVEAPGADAVLTPEDKLAARQVALGCTQNMLMALDREQRLAYVLDVVFGLDSEAAGAVLGITPTAYRKRLSRARSALDPFVARTCGLVNESADCRCERQLPALRRLESGPDAGSKAQPLRAIHPAEVGEAARHFDAMLRMSDAAAVFRAHPSYRVPDTMVAAIRAVLSAEGYGPLGGRAVQ